VDNTNPKRVPTFWRNFGPGLLWAAAAIGVSHLVQSTRAGAQAGFGLSGVILVAFVLKYPFFEFGPRYAAATGASLVEGYRRIGTWALVLYLGITLATAGIVQTAVVLFTAFLLQYVFGLGWSIALVAGLLVLACALLLWIGRFRVLDHTIKVILVLLALSTMAAAVVTLPRADMTTFRIWPGDALGTLVPYAFLLALVGWMPSGLDVSVWSSLWTLAKDQTVGSRASVKTAKLDFLIGYVGTAALAFAFLTLGAGVMFGSGTEFSRVGTVFSTQLVDLYSRTLGTWTRPIVLVAVTTTMLSTSLTVIDGFPRAIDRSFAKLFAADPQATADPAVGPVYWTGMAALGVTTVVVLGRFAGNLTTMVDFATTVSFLTAPILGFLNLKAVTSPEVPAEHRPGRTMLALSWTGLVLLGGTGVVYLAWRVS
jgi:Mn2+/Fe2+ NRAMP family transporter